VSSVALAVVVLPRQFRVCLLLFAGSHVLMKRTRAVCAVLTSLQGVVGWVGGGEGAFCPVSRRVRSPLSLSPC